MKHALITGGGGFIGFHIARHLLERGWRVDVVDDFSHAERDEAITGLAASPGARVRSANLLDPESLTDLGRDHTHVFHMAAILGVAVVLERPYDVLRDNVAMMNRVLDFAASLGRLERLVFPSSSEVYAGTLEHFELPVPTPEETPLALSDLALPRTSYMLSKIYGEALCHHSGLPFTIVRPHNVYGPRMGLRHVVPELLQRAYRAAPGGELEVFSSHHTRTFCYVDDAVEMIRRLAESGDGRQGTFNLGSETGEITIRELAEVVIRAVGKPLTIRPGPTTPGSPERRCPDMTRTVSVAGYESQVALEAGVRRTFEWYRAQVFDRAGAAIAKGAARATRAGSD